ncbi:MAG: hypothetical protein LBK95_17550 [Bifidobacteriaceae bacterium]|jgi:hypothetical protein|nr:hypothetical protein [Bifidobacteriaceae bacterium]
MSDARLRVDRQTKDRVNEMARRDNISVEACVKRLVDRAWEDSGYRLPRKSSATAKRAAEE